jgi:hypothetical protein
MRQGPGRRNERRVVDIRPRRPSISRPRRGRCLGSTHPQPITSGAGFGFRGMPTSSSEPLSWTSCAAGGLGGAPIDPRPRKEAMWVASTKETPGLGDYDDRLRSISSRPLIAAGKAVNQ